MSKEIIIVRLFHALAALYFIFCVIYIYVTAITKDFNLISIVSILSLGLEGLVVFILNKGDCPLIYVQRKINDPVPFFNLFLSPKLAKKVIPFFTILTFVGIFILLIRFLI